MSKTVEEIIEDVKQINDDDLTHILEPYHDEMHDQILLLDISKQDLENENYENIKEVGYKRDYLDEEELYDMIYYYFKKCIEWYKNTPFDASTYPEEAQKETKLIVDEEKEYEENTKLTLLYCEGIYVWCIGGY